MEWESFLLSAKRAALLTLAVSMVLHMGGRIRRQSLDTGWETFEPEAFQEANKPERMSRWMAMEENEAAYAALSDREEKADQEIAADQETMADQETIADEETMAGQGEMTTQEEEQYVEAANIEEHVILRESASKEEPLVREEAKSISSGDYHILQRIVQAEAGNCDLTGRILVANVVMNRVQSGQFPNTVKDVVYQKSQFSPVSNGSIDRCTVSPQTREAVDRALAGEDYSKGALYFMNRAAAQKGAANWFDRKLTYLFQHGGHEFYK